MNISPSKFTASVSDLEKRGYTMLSDVVQQSLLDQLTDAIEQTRTALSSATAPGMRQLLKHCPAVRMASDLPEIKAPVQAVLGSNVRVVRAILFDKTPASNWYVTWHQDLSI